MTPISTPEFYLYVKKNSSPACRRLFAEFAQIPSNVQVIDLETSSSVPPYLTRIPSLYHVNYGTIYDGKNAFTMISQIIEYQDKEAARKAQLEKEEKQKEQTKRSPSPNPMRDMFNEEMTDETQLLNNDQKLNAKTSIQDVEDIMKKRSEMDKSLNPTQRQPN